MEILAVVLFFAFFVLLCLFVRKNYKKHPQKSVAQYALCATLLGWIPIVGPLAIWLCGVIMGVDKEIRNMIAKKSYDTSVDVGKILKDHEDEKFRQNQLHEARYMLEKLGYGAGKTLEVSADGQYFKLEDDPDWVPMSEIKRVYNQYN